MSFARDNMAPQLANGIGQTAQQRWGVGGGGGPHSDLNTQNPFAGNMGATSRDVAMNEIQHELGGSDLTFGSRSGVREMEGFMNMMQMEGEPVIVERLIVDNYMGPNSPHFQVLPPYKMSHDQVAGRKLKQIRILDYWPEQTPEFVPPGMQGYEVSEIVSKPVRYAIGYRIPGDMIFTPVGKRFDEAYQASCASVLNKNAACIITCALLAVPDMYRTKRSDMAVGQYSASDMNEKIMSHQGPMNNGSILASPGMVGIANRPNGIEWMLSWSRRVSAQHGVRPNFIFQNAGVLENEAFRPYRTQFANRGPEANANLSGGEEAMNAKISDKFPGIVFIDEPTYEPENMPNEQLQNLSTNAQFGRYGFLDNDVFKDKLASCEPNEYGRQCGSGAWRPNDYLYLDLSGDGDIECHRYDDLVRSAICFDKTGNLNMQAYEEMINSDWKRLANEALGIKVTDESRFKLDPWVVRGDHNTNRVVRVVGNQDVYHTDINMTRTILTAACRSVYYSALGEKGARHVSQLVDWMRRNRMVSYDRQGNMGAFWAALAWENNNFDDVQQQGGVILRELQKTKGGVRPPRVSPIMTTRGEYSSKYVAFTTDFGGTEHVLVKVPTSAGAQGFGPLYARGAAAQAGQAGQVALRDGLTPRDVRLARRFPQYMFVPAIDLITRGMFDENTRQFIENGTGIFDVTTVLGEVPLEGVQPAIWPRNKSNGALLPGFSTFSNVRALVHMMDTSEEVNGWADVLGEKQLDMIREGFHTAMNYARTVESIFSPRGDSGATIGANLFFRDSMLPAYQRDEDDRRANELLAFLQHAVGGVTPELGIVSPYLITGDANNQNLMTPRFSNPVSVGNETVSIGVSRTGPNNNLNRAPLPGMYDIGPQGGQPGSADVLGLPDILFPRTLGGQQPSYTRNEVRHAMALMGIPTTEARFNAIDELLRSEIVNDRTTTQSFVDDGESYVGDAKTMLVVGYMLHGLQTSKYADMRPYLLLPDDAPYQSAGTIDREPWVTFRNKWNTLYRRPVTDVLTFILRSVVERISDDQFINLMNRRQGADFKDLNILFNVTLRYVHSLIQSVNEYRPDHPEVGRQDPPRWTQIRDSDTTRDEVVKFHQDILNMQYQQVEEQMSRQPAVAATSGQQAGVRQTTERRDAMQTLYTFLEGQSRISNIVGLGVSIDKSYFDSAEHVAREVLGSNMPRGYGASLTIVRPASASEPGEFAGAPPMANLGREDVNTRQNWAAEFENAYEDIQKHGGAAHRKSTYFENSMGVMGAYGRGRGGGGYHRGGARHTRRRLATPVNMPSYAQQYGGAHYERAGDDEDDDTHGLPGDMRAAASLVSRQRRRQRFDRDDDEDDAVETVLGSMVQGVHADEMPNQHFYQRLDALKDNVEHRWEQRSLLYALLGAVPSAQLMCRLHEHGIPAPMTLLIMEPFIDLRMRAIILVQGGAETGGLGYTLNIERKDFDASRTVYVTHITSVMGAHVDRPERVQVFPYAAFDRVVRGGTMRIVKNYRTQTVGDIDTEVDWDVNQPLDRKDAFVLHCGGSTTRKDLSTHLPLTGGIAGHDQYRFFGDRVIDERYMPTICDNMQAYPCAILANMIAQWFLLNAGKHRDVLVPTNALQLRDEMSTPGQRSNMWVSRACQWQHNPSNPARPTLRSRGYGPIGDVREGQASVLHGKPPALAGRIGNDQGLLVNAAAT